MDVRHVANCQKLRENFEGKTGIYVEKGVLCVRIVNIRPNVRQRRVDASVEEIPTNGLQDQWCRRRLNQQSPLRWEISCGPSSSFSDHFWDMGYGGWELFFKPEIVNGVSELASCFPLALGEQDRYKSVLAFLYGHDAYTDEHY